MTTKLFQNRGKLKIVCASAFQFKKKLEAMSKSSLQESLQRNKNDFRKCELAITLNNSLY